MIEVIPSVSIKQGKVVRTQKGDIDDVLVYDKNPVDLAMEFEDAGIKRVHLIDLDGAKIRRVVNYNALELMAHYSNLQIDFSGGIAREEDVRTAFEFGAKFVTAATIAVHDKETFHSWMITYGSEKIILAADALNRQILTKGWKKDTGLTLMEHITYYQERGIKYLKSTEITRDGAQMGPDFEMYKEILDEFPDLKVLASGGIRDVDDIKKLEEIGVAGVIFGKSFYEGRLKLSDLKEFVV